MTSMVPAEEVEAPGCVAEPHGPYSSVDTLMLSDIATRLRKGEDVPREQVATAVRTALQALTELHPGKAAEIRVAPFGAAQILGGHVHRRGTPSTVVALSASTFMSLVVGTVTADEAARSPGSSISGTRSADTLAALYGACQ
jgi:hypothetical protein